MPPSTANTVRLADASAASKARALDTYGKLPLNFEASSGQVNSSVKFLSRGRGYTLFLTGDEAVLSLTKPQGEVSASRSTKPDLESKAASAEAIDAIVRMKLVGANTSAVVMGGEELPSKSNYFLGNDPAKWQSNVPNYAQVEYRSVYPGVNLVYYGNQSGHLEYDFVVAPGADPSVIALNVAASGSAKSHLRIAANGDLVVRADGGDIRFQKPLLYQPGANNAMGKSDSGSRTAVEGHYVLKANHQVRFEIAGYDHTRPLYIDPVLVYSTYLGGSKNDYGQGVALDSSGNAYVTGYTSSVDFPTTSGGYETSCPTLCPAGLHVAFVAKLNPAGSALVYSTYLGSSTQGYSLGSGISVDSSGNVYLAGTTSSASFPVTSGAFQTTNPGTGTNQIVGFVTKLNPTGSALVYSTYLGASNFVNGNAIAIDSTGNAYITGSTQAGDFPTLHPVQAAFGGTIGSSNNVFVTELNPTGTALVFSTYLGGSYSDQGNGIFADNSGNVYVGGYTTSSDFPLLHSYDAYPTGVSGMADAFVAKLNWNGTSLVLVYSTLLGDTNSATAMASEGTAIAVDPSGNVYLTGWTNAADFPTTASAYQKTYAGGSDTFVAKLSWNGSTLSLPYSTFLGGSGQDHANAIAIDSSGNAYVAGTTLSTNFPTLNAVLSTSGGGYYAFVTELNPAGSALVYSTYLGGADPSGYGTSGYGIAVDAAGNAYVTGNTGATNFPTTASPLQSACGGCSLGNVTVFVSKLPTATTAPSAGLSPITLPFGNQNLLTTSASQPVTLSNTGTAALAINSIAASANFGETNNCGSSLAIGASCTINVTFAPTAGGALTGTLTVTDNNNLVANSTQTVSLTGTGIVINTGSLSPPTLPFGNQPINTTSSTPGTAVLTNTGNVPITSIVVSVTGTNASAFTAFSGCGTSLAVGATCNISVNFNPTVTGANSATLNIADSATGSPQTAALTGTGVATSVVAPAPLVFNPVAVCVSSCSAQTITATFTLNGYAAGFTPTAALHYGTSYSIGAVNCTGTAGSETCSVPVTFRPQYPGGRREALFVLNGTSRISTLLIYGIGQAPFAMVQPGVVTNPILNNANYLYTSIVDENGTAYVLESQANAIESVTKTGVVTTLPIAGLNSPRDLGIDGAGVLYIADQTFNGPTITFDTVRGIQGTVPFAAPSIYVQGIAVGNTGNVYETDAVNVYTVPITGPGTASTKAINPAITQGYILAVDSNENVFIGGYEINEITSGGVQTQVNTIGAGDGLGTDAADTLYATRYTGTTGVAELPATGYSSFEAALDLGSSPLGASVAPDGTVYVGNYTNLDKVDRSQGVIAFGQISAATTQNISIYNGGNQPLTITNIAIAGTGFTLQTAATNPCTLNVAIAPGALCQVAVTLTPPHAGTYSGTVTFTDNSLNSATSTQTAALSGAEYGVYVTESPTPINFPSQIVNTTSAAQPATLTNSGELYTANLGVPVSSSPVYAVGYGTCSAGIAPGASCNLSITFTPTAAQSYNNVTVTVPYLSSGGGTAPPPVTFTVNGTGAPAAAPLAVLSPSPLALPSTIVGETSALPMTLSNPGTASLTITGISVTGTNASNFSQTNNCGTTLAAGASCTITVTFNATSTAAVSASISVADNASGSPHTAALSGSGITFISNVGTALAAQPVAVFFANAGTMNSIQVLTQGAPGLDFTSSTGGTCAIGTAYTAGQFCTVNVVFMPKSAGARAGAVLLTDSSGNALATTYLPGTGLGPQIVFSPSTSTTVPTSGLQQPFGIAVDAGDNIYIPDRINNRVVKVPRTGTTYGAQTVVSVTGLASPWDMTVDGSGNLYIADSANHRVVKVPWTGSAYGTQTIVPTTNLIYPQGIAVDGNGNLYMTEQTGDTLSSNIVKVPWTAAGYGAQTTVGTGVGNPVGIKVDGSGNVFVVDNGSNSVVKVPWTGSGYGAQTTVPTTGLSNPTGLALDGSGDVYVADTSNGRVIKVAWNGVTYGAQTTVATGLDSDEGVAIDGSGNVFIDNTFADQVIEVDVADPPSLSFAATNVGSTSTDSPKTVTVSNIGTASFALVVPGSGSNPSYPTNFPANSSDASLCASGTPLAEGATCDVSMNFRPTTSGSLTGNVVLTDNQLNVSGATQSIAVSGTGNAAAAPVAALSPNPLAFPSTTVASTATALPVTLSNTGNATLTGIAISITGTNPSDFATTSATTCGTTLAAGTNCLIYVSFTPASATSFSATLSVADNASGSPQTVVLTGTGTTAPTPQAALSPNPLAFPGTMVGTAATALPMTLSNSGTAALAITGISVTGTNSSSFGESNNCGTSLAAGANCTITVTFTPASAGSLSASISVVDNATGSPHTAAVTGTGTAPQAVFTVNPLAFTSTLVGTSATTQSTTLSNPGTAPLTITGISITGTNSSSFGQSNTCGTSLAVGATCTFTVTFTPASAGSLGASISVADNAAGSPQTVALAGTGTAPQAVLSPNPLAFPSTLVGTAATALPMTLSNPGTAALTISSISVTGANASSFGQSNNCGSSLAVGATCTITVTFTPVSAASLTASISIADSAAGSPQSAAVTGTGTPPLIPQAVLSPNPLAFPTTTINTSATPLPMTLSNSGNTALTISSISVTGANASSFGETNTCGVSLAAAATCTITVSFTPTSAASFTASISIADNAAGSPQSASITGTGSVGTFVVNSSTTSASVQPGAVAQFNILVNPLGGSYNNLVTLSATGLPAGATVSFLPPAVTPGSAGAPSMMSIQTPTGLARLAIPKPQRRTGVPLLALLTGFPLLGLAARRRLFRGVSNRWVLLAFVALATIPVLAISGCGGGYFGPSPQTYTVTVIGTSGALQESTTVSLTVQ